MAGMDEAIARELGQAQQLLRAGDAAAAEALALRVVAGAPRLAEAHAVLAQALHGQGRLPQALASYRAVAGLAPGWLPAWLNAGLVALAMGDDADAAASFREAARLDPASVAAWDGLSRALAHAGSADEAIAATQCLVELAPREPRYWHRLAVSLAGQHLNRRAREAYDALLALDPDFLPGRWERWQCLPVVLADDAEGARALQEWERELGFWEALPPDDPRLAYYAHDLAGGSTNFYLHGLGVALPGLQQRYARLVARLARLAWRAPDPIRAEASPRIRVGFASPSLGRHTIGKLFRSWPLLLDRDRFEVHVFDLRGTGDAEARELAQKADRFVAGPLPTQEWLERIAASALDALVWLDVGMDPQVQALASFRLAPAQGTCWGHPVTTGFDSMDFFLTSELMEPADGDAHYTERLVRLPRLAIAYAPPQLEPDPEFAASEAMRPASVRYVCPQAAFKLLPAHDRVFARILAADRHATLTLVPHRNPAVALELVERMRPVFVAHGVDIAQQLRWLPFLGEPEFLALCRGADVMLDSLHWSGGNTTLEALWFDLPVVTLPGPLMRGRHTAAMLRRMGLEELVARDEDEYARIAVELGRDPAFRARMRAEIADRKHLLYDDASVVPALEAFLLDAVAGTRVQPEPGK